MLGTKEGSLERKREDGSFCFVLFFVFSNLCCLFHRSLSSSTFSLKSMCFHLPLSSLTSPSEACSCETSIISSKITFLIEKAEPILDLQFLD